MDRNIFTRAVGPSTLVALLVLTGCSESADPEGEAQSSGQANAVDSEHQAEGASFEGSDEFVETCEKYDFTPILEAVPDLQEPGRAYAADSSSESSDAAVCYLEYEEAAKERLENERYLEHGDLKDQWEIRFAEWPVTPETGVVEYNDQFSTTTLDSGTVVHTLVLPSYSGRAAFLLVGQTSEGRGFELGAHFFETDDFDADKVEQALIEVVDPA